MSNWRLGWRFIKRINVVPAPCRDAGKGGILFPKRIPPLDPPEKGEGPCPLTPHIGSLQLEELHALRNVSAVYMASP